MPLLWVLRDVLDAGTEVVCIVGKSWDYHVTEALQTTLDENQYGLPIILVSSLVAVGPNVASFEPMVSNPYAESSRREVARV